MSTNYFKSGEWFPAQYVSQVLNNQGFSTTTKKIGDICNDLALDGLVDRSWEGGNKAIGRCTYRKRAHGREYLMKHWRKHTNKELGAEQVCPFPA